MQSADERVHKMISVMVEAQLCKILNEVKTVNIQTQKQQEFKSTLTFEDLSRALEEFGIVIRRPPFLDDKGFGPSASSGPSISSGALSNPKQGVKRPPTN